MGRFSQSRLCSAYLVKISWFKCSSHPCGSRVSSTYLIFSLGSWRAAQTKHTQSWTLPPSQKKEMLFFQVQVKPQTLKSPLTLFLSHSPSHNLSANSAGFTFTISVMWLFLITQVLAATFSLPEECIVFQTFFLLPPLFPWSLSSTMQLRHPMKMYIKLVSPLFEIFCWWLPSSLGVKARRPPTAHGAFCDLTSSSIISSGPALQLFAFLLFLEFAVCVSLMPSALLF